MTLAHFKVNELLNTTYSTASVCLQRLYGYVLGLKHLFGVA